ncbi:MAG: carboxypeptidase regulatory-like domain-containing protein [Planctomycetota bacterium]
MPHAAARCCALSALLVPFVAGAAAIAQDALPAGPLRVTVLDVDGQPRRGAFVEVYRYDGADAGYSNLDLDEKEHRQRVGRLPTPKSGSVGFQLPAAIPYRVLVDVPPFAIEWRSGVHAGDELTIQLRDGAIVEGVVRDDTGAPIPAEHVMVMAKTDPRSGHRYAQAGADGAFRFDRLMPGPWYVDAESTHAAVHGGQGVALVSGETTEVTFALDRGATVRGRVVDASTGKPIRGARFGVGWTFDKPVLTDADGRFVMKGLGGPFGNNLFLSCPGYCELQVQRPKQKTGVVEIELEMERGVTVTGRILDRDGAPASDCYVAVVGMSHNGRMQETDWLSTRTDANGRYTIGDVRAVLQPVLLVRRDGCGRLTTAIPMAGAKAGDRVTVPDVRLRPRRIVHGVLRDAGGLPIAGQRVKLLGNHRGAPANTAHGGGFLSHYLAERRTWTDANGRFFFGDLLEGGYILEVDKVQQAVDVHEGVPTEPIEVTR